MACVSFLHSQPPRTPSEELRGKLKWMTLEGREKAWLVRVQRCVIKKVPQCLNARFRTNAKVGNQVSQGHDHRKLFVPRVNTE
jgi:hypothetical protein